MSKRNPFVTEKFVFDRKSHTQCGKANTILEHAKWHLFDKQPTDIAGRPMDIFGCVDDGYADAWAILIDAQKRVHAANDATQAAAKRKYYGEK